MGPALSRIDAGVTLLVRPRAALAPPLSRETLTSEARRQGRFVGLQKIGHDCGGLGIATVNDLGLIDQLDVAFVFTQGDHQSVMWSLDMVLVTDARGTSRIRSRNTSESVAA